MHIPLLDDIVIILGLSIGVMLLTSRLRIPAIIGFLVTGILAGPHGFGLIHAHKEVELLAEVGVVLLLFTIGLEFSFQNLLRIKRSVLLGGTIQVAFTILAGALAAHLMDRPFRQALLVGFLLSLSSTAIVLQLLQQRGQVDSPHGHTALGILIFQDLAIVPMMLMTPILAGEGGDVATTAAWLVGKAILILVLLVLAAKWVLPWILLRIVRTRSPQLFVVTVVGICLAVAAATSHAGLSLALGAFLAGLVLSESEYGHQALADMLPFRDMFTSFFFVSVGMLLDVRFLMENPLLVIALTVGVLVSKTIIAGLATLALGLPVRIAVLVGLSLSQVGEFSFLLSKVASDAGLMTEATYQLFLAVSVMTMAATPACMAIAPRLADAVTRLPLPARLRGAAPHPPLEERPNDHVIIVGYGPSGRNLVRAAKVGGVPYVIVELNPDTVRKERAQGEPIVWGDASREAVMEHVGIRDARTVVVVMSDPTATRRAIELARRMNPSVHIIVRTRFVDEMAPLYQVGASDVIPEELESSVEIFTRVLAQYLVPRDEIEKVVSEVRADSYGMLRAVTDGPLPLESCAVHIPDLKVSTCRVGSGSSWVGRTLEDIGLRKKHKVTVVAIRRGEETIGLPGARVELEAGDILLLFARPGDVAPVASRCAGA